jgi:hypothetical protein
MGRVRWRGEGGKRFCRRFFLTRLILNKVNSENNYKFLKNRFLARTFIGARYKGKLSHFEISMKLQSFYTHIDPFEGRKIVNTI